ncbi:KilA-N, DNA-binding domain protein [Sulfurovum sp. enrichment culture clone C5]|uniref:KilA-N, DNA-binding domain protein n=1 Tax=Sulfurovum sp. enrichment culture clone C5 TaxID=497650 RepID=A0A0S4XL26_9BACT|nr:KilA-N, DNA-binding domain protein [Sulfurovum sp. enrichment culture clone C5]
MENLPIEDITSKIYEIRGQKVMLDSDLANLYQVESKRLNEQVRRNIERFPSDFMFQISEIEHENLRSQFATSSFEHGGRRYLPYVFTEQGVYMLATVLKSKVAIDVSIQIMRTFTALRRYALTYDELAKKIVEIESRVSDSEKRDQKIIGIINQLMSDDEESEVKKIGFIKDK